MVVIANSLTHPTFKMHDRIAASTLHDDISGSVVLPPVSPYLDWFVRCSNVSLQIAVILCKILPILIRSIVAATAWYQM